MTEHAWWKQESARSDLLVAIDHFNSAREQADWPRPGWEVDACADMFKGLDKLWSLREQILGPYPTAEGKPASDLRQFKELLKGVGEAAGADLLDSGPVRELAAFGPPILDHTEPGMTQRPLAELPETSGIGQAGPTATSVNSSSGGALCAPTRTQRSPVWHISSPKFATI